jgi:phosphoribosylcarboxyaminoimidazole (NCAIR) mutase
VKLPRAAAVSLTVACFLLRLNVPNAVQVDSTLQTPTKMREMQKETDDEKAEIIAQTARLESRAEVVPAGASQQIRVACSILAQQT